MLDFATEPATRTTNYVLSDLTRGFLAGTKVATMAGWRAVEGITVGDKVLTFDNGFQVVTAVGHHHVASFGAHDDPAHWPLFVPKGALGNRDDMHLLPDQVVMIESDVAERLYGDPFAMVPAKSLEGYRQITRVAPPADMTVITLHFDDDQIVFANMGALFHCPADGDLLTQIFGGYEVMSVAEGDTLIALMELEESDDASRTKLRQRATGAQGVAA